MEHSYVWRGLIGAAVMVGSIVAAVVPDEFIGVAGTVGAGLLAWTASTLWKSAATTARVVARLDEHDRRLDEHDRRLNNLESHKEKQA